MSKELKILQMRLKLEKYESIIDSQKAEIKTLKEKVRELENPWISVEDELPEQKYDVDEYLCVWGDYVGSFGYDKKMGFCYYDTEEYCWFPEERQDDFTHWCHLPQPPTKG